MPQLVRWGPVDSMPAGIFVDNENEQVFIEWESLKPELERMLLPQIRRFPVDSEVRTLDMDGRKDWLARVFGPTGELLGALWFGPDPDGAWKYDGLVRVGEPSQHSTREVNVWQTFQRYSDGSYRLIEARVVK
jgi:hypothetical protein